MSQLMQALDSMDTNRLEIAGIRNVVIEDFNDIHVLTRMSTVLEHAGVNVPTDCISVARIQSEHIARKLGLTRYKGIPSVECFQNKHERKIAYAVATEGLIDMIVSIWRAIKRAVLRMWEAIKKFFRDMFSAVRLLEKRIESLKKKIDDLGTTDGEEKIKDDEIVRAFSIAGRYTNSNINSVLENQCEVTTDLNKLSTRMNEICEKASKMIDEGIKTILEIKDPGINADTNRPNELAVGSDSISDSCSKAITTLMTTAKAALILELRMTEKSVSEGVVAKSTHAYLYGKTLELSVVNNGDVNELSIEIVTPTDYVSKDVSVLTVSEMKTILASCSKLLKMDTVVNNAGSTIGKVTSRLVKITDKVEEILTEINKRYYMKEQLPNISKEMSTIKPFIDSMISVINTVYTSLPAMNITAIKLAVGFIETSMSHYNTK